MATLLELNSLLERGTQENADLRGKVRAAYLIACFDMLNEAYADPLLPTEQELQRKRFAKAQLASVNANTDRLDKHGDMERIYRAVLIQSKAFTLAQIYNASDVNIQNQVDAVVGSFATNF